jgi:hypothetical protein
MSAAPQISYWNTPPAPARAPQPPIDIKTGQLLRLPNVEIEDVRGLGADAVARLAEILRGGAPFTKDRNRPRFYEVHAGEERYYVHVLKGVSKVLLLAKWKIVPQTTD